MERSLQTLDSLGYAASQERGEQLRRVLNFTIGAVGIVITLPLMILIAIWVKLSSPGPIIFTQTRVGLDRRRGVSRNGRGPCRRRRDIGGRLIGIHKFRTMTVQEPGADQVWAVPDDPRITSAGRFLRRSRLDELPQLYNVLKGDMNVVGPRPEQPAIFEELRERFDLYPARQRVLPGITGLAQVNNGYDQSLEDVSRKLRYDLEYIQAKSPLTDLQIMARTIPVMIFRDGAL